MWAPRRQMAISEHIIGGAHNWGGAGAGYSCQLMSGGQGCRYMSTMHRTVLSSITKNYLAQNTTNAKVRKPENNPFFKISTFAARIFSQGSQAPRYIIFFERSYLFCSPILLSWPSLYTVVSRTSQTIHGAQLSPLPTLVKFPLSSMRSRPQS